VYRTVLFLILFFSFFFFFFHPVQAATTYYVSTSGSDNNLGTSELQPFKTIFKINSLALNQGDVVLFKRNETWIDGIRLMAASGVTYDTYGTGTLPIIDGTGASGAFAVLGQTGVTVRNLHFRKGTDATVSLAPTNFLMENSEVEQGGFNCISLMATANYAVNNVTLRNIQAHNALSGMGLYLAGDNAGHWPTNVVVELSQFYANGSVATQHHGLYAKYMGAGANIVIRNNIAFDNIASGFLASYAAANANIQFYNNKSYNNGQSGIWINNYDAGCLATFYNNLIYGNNDKGITISHLVSGVTISFNTLVNNKSNGLGLMEAGCTGNTIMNNIIYQDAGVIGNVRPYRIYSTSTGGPADNMFDYNLVYYPNNTDGNNVVNQISPVSFYNWSTWQQLTGLPDSHSLNVDPKFVNVSINDYHLQSNSPAINSGKTLLSFTTDYDGINRPQGNGFDIGAFEYSATVIPSPSPTATPTNNPKCQADVNLDKVVNLADITQILGKWGQSCFGCKEDTVTDGVVNLADLSYILRYWGQSCN
jgi:hypothetical protein